ncbi:MAG: TetR/AcrR family transcriptional regulator [Gammaproteobacteria bacterium]|nr:TetR/AcrR family transcriptional regulator [Gammaproteobacteria bacterium]
MRLAPARVHAPRLSRAQRIDEILQAARELFCEKGYESTLMSEIAARIGVVEGTLYKYFSTKRELLLRVLEHWYEEMFGDCAQDLVSLSSARARLHQLIWRHLRSIRDYPQLCRLMFREARADAGYRESNLHALNRRYTRFLMDVVEQGVATGEFRHDMPAELLRDLVYGGIEHHAWSYFNGRGRLDIDRLAQRIGDLLCEGLIRPPEILIP